MTQLADGSEKRKKQIRKIIEQRGLCSMMNATKWRELKKVVGELPFQPPFVVKKVDEEESSYHDFNQDVWFGGDWGLYLDNYLGGDISATPYYAVEWVKVRPRILQPPGRLAPVKVIDNDETELFVEGLKKYNIPYEQVDGTIIIYGYR